MKEVSHKRPRVVWFHLAHQPTPQRQKVDWSEGIEERRTSEVQDFFWCWWDSWESCRLYWPHGTAQPPHCTLQTAHSVTWTLSLYKKLSLWIMDVFAMARRLSGVVPHHLFDFFFYCLPFCSPCSNHAALAFLFFFKNPEHDHRSEFAVSFIRNTLPPDNHSKPPLSICSLDYLLCEALSSYPEWNCIPPPMPTMPLSLSCFLFLHRIYHIQTLQNINNLAVVYYHPPHPSGM